MGVWRKLYVRRHLWGGRARRSNGEKKICEAALVYCRLLTILSTCTIAKPVVAPFDAENIILS